MRLNLKTLVWVGSSLDDLKKLPIHIQREIGFSLHQIQEGKTPVNVKMMKGLGAGIYEIISNFNKGTYRAVYAAKLDNQIYVLHVFQKKSKQGIETPKQEISLIKSRFTLAKNDADAY